MELSEPQQRILVAINDALLALVEQVQFPGIVRAEMQSVALGADQLQRIIVDLAQHGSAYVTFSSDVELFLQISNTDLLRSVESTEFCVRLTSDNATFHATANTRKDWSLAWQHGIEPLKEAALQGMREDIACFNAGLSEDSYRFQAAMVLLASEFVGPYVECIARLLKYPQSLVAVVGVRLQEAGIWEVDQVRCEEWFDLENGGMSFLLATMIAEGTVVRKWSSECQTYLYRSAEMQGPKLAI